MWTTENRSRYDRRGLRCPSDVTDGEWALIAGLIPPAKRGGNARTVDLREVVNGLLHVLGTGCQWRAIPKDLPPRSTLHGSFMRWEWDGTLGRIHHALHVLCREADRLLGQLVRYPLCLKAGGLTLVDLIKHASYNQPLVETIRLNGAAYSALRCHPPFDHN
jgi:transposase